MALKLLGSLESSGGNVGIGIASPVSTLHIKTSVDNSVAQGLVIERSANSDRGYINYNGGGFQFRSTVGDPIVFGETDAEHMRILPDGNVGIGTTTPSAKLHVSGNILGSTITAPATHSKSKFRLHGTGNDAHSIGTRLICKYIWPWHLGFWYNNAPILRLNRRYYSATWGRRVNSIK